MCNDDGIHERNNYALQTKAHSDCIANSYEQMKFTNHKAMTLFFSLPAHWERESAPVHWRDDFSMEASTGACKNLWFGIYLSTREP